ncbi:antibiotic biosynthesis monooxygenase [Limosilactobacillus equigenerosi]|uniref:antibiotic biosynthesis monooxygenase n=1 Tax=Limosilactobacillus equigenerosi TaxID=417373 RepID=UPI0006D2399F|nr:antibiotic biosynthesis monooxygenase [Limosilactobacillus equigenerosi]
MKYLHYTTGSESIMKMVKADNPKRNLRLAYELDHNRYALFDLTGHAESIYTTPISYQIWGQSQAAKLIGISRIEVFKLGNDEQEIWQTKLQKFMTEDHEGCNGMYWLKDARNTSNVAVLTCWKDSKALQAWQQSNEHRELTQFNHNYAKILINCITMRILSF